MLEGVVDAGARMGSFYEPRIWGRAEVFWVYPGPQGYFVDALFELPSCL